MKNFKWTYKSLIILLFPYNSIAQLIDSSQFLVKTQYGLVKGSTENGIYVWKGIDYASAPINELRFKAPQPPQKWDTIKSAMEFGSACPQLNVVENTFPTSENCLNLNIWSPSTKDKKHPVMVWIHGGAFYTGSGSWSIYNGSKLSQNGDVVVVTINYRLGALGFLNFDEINCNENGFESNLGIKDQVAALRWVKENIEAFGGDPNNITIFGESAGATSVLTLMSTPNANGLFHKAIAESPPINSFWTPEEATAVTKRYLSLLNINENSLDKLYEFSADTLVKVAYEMIQNYSYEIPGIGTFAPTVDNKFILSLYSDCSKADTSAFAIPLLIGTNKNEMNLFNKMEMIPFSGKEIEIERMVPSISEEQIDRISNVYKRRNFRKEQLITNVCTDGVFRLPSIQLADEKSKCAPTYMYRFDWRSAPLFVSGYRTFHGLDIFFVFNSFDTKAGKRVTTLTRKKKVYDISNDMQEAWVNFARTGNPNGDGEEKWKPYNSEDRATMIFSRRSKLKLDPNYKQRMAWQGIDMD